MNPLRACAAEWSSRHPDVEITWDARPLAAFEDQPVAEVASAYDLLVIDHPMCGTMAESGLVQAIDDVLDPEALSEIERGSVGASYASYRYAGHQWALPIDIASQVSAVRGGFAGTAPASWDETLELARATPGRVALPLAPAHALSSLLTLCANQGASPASGRGELAKPAAAGKALHLLSELAALGPDDAFDWDPPAALETLTTGDRLDYIPLTYGYITYATPVVTAPCRFRDIPSSGLGPVGAVLGGAGVAISALSAKIDAAVSVAAWIAGSEAQRTIVAQSAGQPSGRAAWDDPALNAATGGFFRDTRATLDSAFVRPRDPWWPRFQIEGGELLHSGLRGRAPLDALLNEINECYREHRGAPRETAT